MITLTKKHLIITAAIVWYSGSASLVLKALSLLKSAYQIDSNLILIIISVILGITIGVFKGKFLFVKSCRNNIERINNLQKVRAWLFFKPSFMVALAAMISTGAILSRLAVGNYYILLVVAILDLTIGTALFYSSFEYWKKSPVPQKQF